MHNKKFGYNWRSESANDIDPGSAALIQIYFGRGRKSLYGGKVTQIHSHFTPIFYWGSEVIALPLESTPMLWIYN